MKVTIDIDCTPAEARQFMGLPDLQPLQKAMLDEMEKRMLAEVDRFSPDSLLKVWFSAVPQNAEWMQSLFGTMFPGGRPTENKDS